MGNLFGKVTEFAGGLRDKIQGAAMAAEEAVPAIVGGLFGQDRTDTSMRPSMSQAVLDARKRAKADGSKRVEYKHYDSSGPGMAARLTTGVVGFDEFKKDDQGNVTGFTQRYDTDKTPQEALSEFNITKPKTWYKPAEAALAYSQQGGVTTHDVNISPKKPPTQTPDSPNYVANSPMTTKASAPAQTSSPATSYAVKAGDTLSAIARKRGMSVAEIAKKNNIQNIDQIGIGQKLNF